MSKGAWVAIILGVLVVIYLLSSRTTVYPTTGSTGTLGGIFGALGAGLGGYARAGGFSSTSGQRGTTFSNPYSSGEPIYTGPSTTSLNTYDPNEAGRSAAYNQAIAEGYTPAQASIYYA